jgi:chorismate mutase
MPAEPDRPLDAAPAHAPPLAPMARRPRSLRALRGATTVARDAADAILDATRELLQEVMQRNGVCADDVVSAIFTTTRDLTSEYPAAAARALGWAGVPLMCMSEIDVPGGLPRCVRVLIHAEMEPDVPRPRHVYLRDATVLRPDLAAGA